VNARPPAAVPGDAVHIHDFHALFRAADRALPAPRSRRRGVAAEGPPCGPALVRGRGRARRRFRLRRLAVPAVACLVAAAVVLRLWRAALLPFLT